ncbi:MAG TPA: MBOAT family O-acyltransferase [Myxococcales bacterium]|nr:MBOAT family O-acyltransferase [Myxococcales bacterium]
MLFHSVQFLALFGITFAVYWQVVKWKWPRLLVLFVASFLFYAAWSPLPVLLFCWYALVNWIAAGLIVRFGEPGRERPRARKWVLGLAVVSHLSVLATFKYLNLFLATAGSLAARVGLDWTAPKLGLLLPIGLSFVAFQAIAYIVDLYRGDLEGGHSYFEHVLYLLFFPHVVAGPIVRAKYLIGRFHLVPTLAPEQGARALFRMATGIAKKLLIADVISTGLVDRVFENPSLYTSAECAVACVAYTFQIYFDFSAYSDVAIGAATLFGFPLPENFNKPYHATNLFQFWNRWHLSLSTWLRDYLYIPLGGNRGSNARTLRNLMIVMVLGGLWHGADWRFALWGGIHGTFLVLIRCYWWYVNPAAEKAKKGFAGAAVGLLATMTCVVLTRVFFRAPDIQHAFAMFQQLAHFTGGLANVSRVVWITLGGGIFLYALPKTAYEGAVAAFTRVPVPVRAAALLALGLVARKIAGFEVQPYIYFQF